ncbi:hypothetical protein JL720_6723 [Aureococcus anophagefferens]|nr:hypothetical protein JL720_6723 [Aureococcus anophagefferens]
MGKRSKETSSGDASTKKKKAKASATPANAVTLTPAAPPSRDGTEGAFKSMAVAAHFALLPHCLDDVRVHIRQLLQDQLMRFVGAGGASSASSHGYFNASVDKAELGGWAFDGAKWTNGDADLAVGTLMVVDGGSAGQFEALLSAQLDLSLSRAVTAARLEGEQRGGGSASVVELIEARRPRASSRSSRGCPENGLGALQLLLGRPLPGALRGPLWRARLRDEAAATTFRDLRRRGVVATISPFDADITARCAEILGPRDFGADGLAAMKTALSYLDARHRYAAPPRCRGRAEKATLPHLVYSAYNALRVKHDLAVVAAAQHRDIVAAEEAIAAAKRAEARRAAAEEQRRLEAEARRSATRVRDRGGGGARRGRARAAKREAAAATAAEALGAAFLACVAEAKAARDAAAAARAKYDAAEADRDRVIRDAVAAVQQSVYRHTYAPADLAALDAKAEGAPEAEREPGAPPAPAAPPAAKPAAPRPPLAPANAASWAPSDPVSPRV